MDNNNDDLSAKQLLVSYIQNKNFNSQIIDEQMQLQSDAADLVKAVREDVDYDDPKRDFWLSREIKGRVDHQMMLKLLFELENNIDHYIEVMSSKHNLVFTSDFGIASFQSNFPSSVLREYPQLIALIMEYHNSIEELLNIAQVLRHMEWDVLDFDIEKLDLEEEVIDFGDSWNREINVKDDLNVYDELLGDIASDIPEIEVDYDSDDGLHNHINQIAEQLTSYYQHHIEMIDEIDLSQIIEGLTEQERYNLQEAMLQYKEHSLIARQGGSPDESEGNKIE